MVTFGNIFTQGVRMMNDQQLDNRMKELVALEVIPVMERAIDKLKSTEGDTFTVDLAVISTLLVYAIKKSLDLYGDKEMSERFIRVSTDLILKMNKG